jgi:hypothetical protein
MHALYHRKSATQNRPPKVGHFNNQLQRNALIKWHATSWNTDIALLIVFWLINIAILTVGQNQWVRTKSRPYKVGLQKSAIENRP